MNWNELYYQDAYLTEFDSEVISCQSRDDGYAIVLKETAFYPEGGGQPGDQGTLNEVHVLDTHQTQDVVIHYTDAPIEPGTRVHGRLNWQRRFDLMQQHSGEHIFSGLVHKTKGYENIGFHLGEDTVTLDFSGVLNEADLLNVETLANEIIWKNVPVQITYPDQKELSTLEFRSKKELEGSVRIVSFPGADVCACCGTHVSHSGEVGLIKVLSFQNRKGGTRVEIVCGNRALKYVQAVFRENTAISHLLSANILETSQAVTRLNQDYGSLLHEIHETTRRLLEEKKAELSDHQPLAVLTASHIDPKDLRVLCNDIVEEKHAGVAAVFSLHEDGWKYVMISKTMDLRPLCKALNARFNGRGGGPGDMVQGALTSGSEEELRQFLQDSLES
ncbi:MAG: hypothetical protein IJ225_11920 [Solobacterium sp.]|nr:hypothetical protein [Solobacterium sp.]